MLAFIKGSTDFPQCGFSNTVVQILKQMEVPFETVDILSNEMLRSGMKEYSQVRSSSKSGWLCSVDSIWHRQHSEHVCYALACGPGRIFVLISVPLLE